jgi:hypothetical protein
MYSFNLLHKLTYYYDADIINYDIFYKVHLITYKINDSLIFPFVEIILDKNGCSLYISDECENITPKRMDAFKVSFESIIENIGLRGRYQGYHCHDNNIYFLYRISQGNAATNLHCDVINCTLNDILIYKRNFSIEINSNVIDYFSLFKNNYKLYYIFNKNTIDVIPETIYNFIENKEKNIEHIKKYNTQYRMINHGPILQLNNDKSKNTVQVKNIVFNKNKIVSFNQLLTYIEK